MRFGDGYYAITLEILDISYRIVWIGNFKLNIYEAINYSVYTATNILISTTIIIYISYGVDQKGLEDNLIITIMCQTQRPLHYAPASGSARPYRISKSFTSASGLQTSPSCI